MNAGRTAKEKKPFARIGLVARSGDNRLSETLTAIYELLRRKRLVVVPEHRRIAVNAGRTAKEKKPFARIGLVAKSGDNRLSETLTAVYGPLRQKRLIAVPEHRRMP